MMTRLRYVTAVLLIASAQASSSEIRFSVSRPLGSGASFGVQTVEMTCTQAGSPCAVKHLFRGQLTDSKKLDYAKAQEIASRLAQGLKNRKPSSKLDARSLSWSFRYQGNTLQGNLASHPKGLDLSGLALMNAEAEMEAESR